MPYRHTITIVIMIIVIIVIIIIVSSYLLHIQHIRSVPSFIILSLVPFGYLPWSAFSYHSFDNLSWALCFVFCFILFAYTVVFNFHICSYSFLTFLSWWHQPHLLQDICKCPPDLTLCYMCQGLFVCLMFQSVYLS